MKQELICIQCPVGCRMDVTVEDETVVSVTGNTCAKGERYAQDECIDPKRIVTTIVRVAGRGTPLPVKTAAPVPKVLMLDCVRALQAVIVEPPVHIGQVILSNVCDCGIDVVATTNVGETAQKKENATFG